MSDFYNYFIKKKVKAYICDLCMCVCVYGGVSDFDYYGYLHNQEIIQTNLNLPKCSDFLAIRITRWGYFYILTTVFVRWNGRVFHILSSLF